MNTIIVKQIEEHQMILEKITVLIPIIEAIGMACKTAIETGHKILLCGNGGSAADSQHIAAEFVGRFVKERCSLPAIALTTDTSILTAVGNDYGYDQIFLRQVEGLGQAGDVLIGISTSGNSANVVKAVELAKTMGIQTFAFTGDGGGKLKELCDLTLAVPTKTTTRVQEMHILAGHIICELVEENY